MSSSKAKTRRRIFIGICALVGLLIVLAAFENLRGKRALRAYKVELIAKGEKLKVEELVPPYSAEANAAANALVRAAWQLPQTGTVLPMNQPPAMRSVAPGKALVGWKQSDIRGSSGRSNRWEELTAQLQDAEPALAEIRAQLKHPRLDWNLNYKKGFNLLLPHLAKLKQIAQWLSAATLNDLHAGNLEPVLGNLKALISLANGLQDERLMISQFVRIAISAIAIGPTWEALQADGWTDAQLAELQTLWESAEFVRAMGRSIEMERAMGVELFDRLRHSSSEREQFFDFYGSAGAGGTTALSPPGSLEDVPEFAGELLKKTMEATGSFGRESLWSWLWSDWDEKRYLEMLQSFLEYSRQAAEGKLNATSSPRLSQLEVNPRHGSPRYYLSSMLTPAMGSALSKAVRIETQRELAFAAVALKRYQLRHGKLPTGLDTLVPDILPRPPVDWMDGKTLRYRLNADGSFVLYSVNEDGKDDAGDPRPLENRRGAPYFTEGRDMVWPQPVTPAELAELEANTNRNQSNYNTLMLERYGLKPKDK